MVSIYLIEDINDLKYVGSTKLKLNKRLSDHRSAKKINNYCSSSKLNLYNCIITQLERSNEENRMEREKYWINKIDCVNKYKLNYDEKQYKKQYMKEYNENNKEKAKNKYIEKVVKNCLDDLITELENKNK